MYIVNYTDYSARWDREKRKEYATKEELDAFVERVNKYCFDIVINSTVEIKNK